MRRLSWLFAFLLATLACAVARADVTDGIGVDEHLGAALPLDTPFVDSSGRAVSLGDSFDHRRPLIVVFGYHSCPMLCGLIQGAVVNALRDDAWAVGREFDVVVISIDPKDTPEVAAARRELIVERYGKARRDWRPSAPELGWHYLVGAAPSIEAVTKAAGYRFVYDAEHDQYGHPAAIVIATPEARIARYLYGVEFAPRDVHFGLLEAAEGRSVSTIDRVLLYCVHYDPATKRYGPLVSHIMQVGGGGILALVASLLGVLWLRERRRSASLG